MAKKRTHFDNIYPIKIDNQMYFQGYDVGYEAGYTIRRYQGCRQDLLGQRHGWLDGYHAATDDIKKNPVKERG